MSENPEHSKEEKSNTGKWFLFWLLAFFFTFASVDAFFVYKAISTHSGVVTENAYEKGLKFNELLDKAEAQKNDER